MMLMMVMMVMMMLMLLMMIMMMAMMTMTIVVVVVADLQIFAGSVDTRGGIELGGEDTQVDIGEDHSQQDHAVALLDKLGDLAATQCPLVETKVERMHLADNALGEHRGRDRDTSLLGQGHRVGLEAVAV